MADASADVVGSEPMVLTFGGSFEWLDSVADASLAGGGFNLSCPLPTTPVGAETSPITEATLRSSIVSYNLISARICEEREAGS